MCVIPGSWAMRDHAETLVDAHDPHGVLRAFWGGGFSFFISLFSRVLPLPSLVLILAAGSWDRFLFMLHIHEMDNRLGFQKSTSIDPPELLGASF